MLGWKISFFFFKEQTNPVCSALLKVVIDSLELINKALKCGGERGRGLHTFSILIIVRVWWRRRLCCRCGIDSMAPLAPLFLLETQAACELQRLPCKLHYDLFVVTWSSWSGADLINKTDWAGDREEEVTLSASKAAGPSTRSEESSVRYFQGARLTGMHQCNCRALELRAWRGRFLRVERFCQCEVARRLMPRHLGRLVSELNRPAGVVLETRPSPGWP